MTADTPQLFPYFQPIVSVASGTIVGYEALARQRNADGHIVSAGKVFSSTALSIEQRLAYDRQVRRMALEQFSQLNNDCYLALNISATWIDHLSQISASPTLKMLDELGVDRDRIIIEITETDADINKLRAIVNRYRSQGLRVALDDFGSGASQIERVLALHPDIIKIDMQLFKKALKGGIASDVVHMLTRLGKRSGCQIICEGIENDEGFLFGLQCGTQYMQGSLFSEADAHFKAADSFTQHIQSLRNKFFKHAIKKEQQQIQTIDVTKQLVYRLKEALQGDFNLNELAQWQFKESHIARFYLCDNHGNQLSPNFDFTASQWFTDPRKIGFNWSWRPYFFQLIALEQNGQSDCIVISEPYHDFNTDWLCKTLTVRLDENRLLLTDVIVDERVITA
jgi:EAL domain-containing protein (putative c-di-GMP-specific phosphodiesterase class I)